MSERDPVDSLREAIARVVAEDAPALVEEAREAARARARAVIEDVLVDELVRAAVALSTSADENESAARDDDVAATGGGGVAASPSTGDDAARASGDGVAASPSTGDDAARASGDDVAASPSRDDVASVSRNDARVEPDRVHSAATDALWAYCVLDAREAAELPDGLEGVAAGSTVARIVEGDLAALVSPVPLSDYDDERLREHLNDIEWVERTARAHEDVLEQALESATVVPLRLCTIYHDHEGIRRLLRDEHDELRRSLEAVAGRAEWGLKLFADPERVRATLAAEASDDDLTGDYGDGAGYLARKQRERDARSAVDDFITRRAEEAHRRLAAVADAARTNPPQRPEAHGQNGEMVLNGVYLVRRTADAELARALDLLRSEWEPQGFSVVLTGPWPAYNFVSGSTAVAP